MVRLSRWLVLIGVFIFGAVCQAQAIRPVRPFSAEGTIRAIRDGMIAITDKTGKSWEMHISTRRDGKVMLGRNQAFAAPRPEVEITGSLPIMEMDRGFLVRFENYIDEEGRLTLPVSEVIWAEDSSFKAGIKVNRRKKDDQGAFACLVSGTVDQVGKGRILLKMPRSRFSPKGRLMAPIADDARLVVRSRDLTKVQPQDRITEVSGYELSTGDYIIQKVVIQLQENRSPDDKQKQPATAAAVDTKYENLSDQPVAPRVVRSQHYLLHTDLSDRDARVLLDKLEHMLGIISRYFGRPQPGVVECYVVDDMEQWQSSLFPDEVKAKIANKEGFTRSVSATSVLGRNTKSTVYACSDPGVVQHEAVHAYCNVTFGSTGPTWYSEGLAEMGQYWKEGQLEVDVDSRVIRFIRRAESPKELKEIIKAGQITGDSSEAYSWRWALCHLLANNPNYNRQFKELGIRMMSGVQGVSFSSVYGRVAKQLTFEYQQFIAHVENGYRVDLCAWRWNHRFEDIPENGHRSVKVAAKAGWQPAIRVEADQDYDFVTNGEWLLDGTGTKADANGDKDGNGQLMGVVMSDYQLSEKLSLGKQGSFKAPTTGELYLRCGEKWGRLGDNSGSITAHFRLAQ